MPSIFCARMVDAMRDGHDGGGKELSISSVASLVGVVGGFTALAWAGYALTGDPPPGLVLTFDPGGQLELGGITIWLYLAMAVLGIGPLSCWLVLRTRGSRRAGPTALMLIPLLALVAVLVLRFSGGTGTSPFTGIGLLAIGSVAAGALARLGALAGSRR